MTQREITGRHVFIGTVAAFGVIIAVNVTMAVQAVGTFPGLEVKNSYVASQSFDTRRAAQQALGWDISAVIENGTLDLAITDQAGTPVRPARLSAVLGRPTIARDDREVTFAPGSGHLRVPVDLAPGAWVLKLEAENDEGVAFSKRISLWVR
jgi:nitrogen fixation protein FixH